MARGFESKDVEFQQAERERQRVIRPAPGATERARTEGEGTIQLSLARARDELARARSPVHRRMLEQAIGVLEAQLASLSNP